jgi:uncharacterized protein
MKLVFKILWALFLFLGGMPVQAADNVPEVTSYINDYEDIISASDEAQMETLGRTLAESTGSQVVVVTTSSLNGMSGAQMATAIGNEAGIGSSNLDNGVVILISVAEKTRFMAIGSGLESVITDIDAEHLQQEYLVPLFQQGDYSQGIADLYSAVASQIQSAADNGEIGTDPMSGQTISNDSSQAASKGGSWIPMFVFVFIVLIICFLIIYALSNKSGSTSNSNNAVELYVGESYQMSVPGIDFADASVKITSTAPEIVSASTTGQLIGLRPGTGVVIVERNGQQYPITVHVISGSGGNYRRHNDELLEGILLGTLLSGRRRRYYAPPPPPRRPAPGPRPGSRPGGSRPGGSRPGGGFSGGSRPGGGFSGGGFRGGGGGFRGGGSGGSW